MSRGSAVFPVPLWQVLIEKQVEPAARFLFVTVFLYAETDTAGFLAWQPRQLSTLTGLSLEQVERAADHLQEKRLLVVDRDWERAWLAPFLEYDTGSKPNMYSSALRSIRVCASQRLKAAAWAEVERIHPPPVKFKPSTSESTKARLMAERDTAYEDLKASIKQAKGEPFENRSRTVREPLPVPEPVPVHEGVPAPGNDDAAWCDEFERERLKQKADRTVREMYEP